MSKIAGGSELAHLDWNKTGDVVQTVSVDYKLEYWNVKSVRPERNGAQLFRDEEWNDLTVPLGFHCAGAWNNVNYKNDDSMVTTAHAGWNRNLVLAADSDGFVRLFRYPCVTPKGEYHEVKACSGAVTAVRFLLDDNYAVTVGGSDAVIVR